MQHNHCWQNSVNKLYSLLLVSSYMFVIPAFNKCHYVYTLSNMLSEDFACMFYREFIYLNKSLLKIQLYQY